MDNSHSEIRNSNEHDSDAAISNAGFPHLTNNWSALNSTGSNPS